MRKRRTRRGRVFTRLLLITLIILGTGWMVKHLFLFIRNAVSQTLPQATERRDDQRLKGFSSNELKSPYAVLISLNDGTILIDNNSRDRIYPASLTKIMTVIVAIENTPDLQQHVLLPARLFNDLYRADASMAGFLPNEEVPAIDLIYGALLPSGAECCVGLADSITGSESGYVDLMNRKAEEIGMKQTHFTNTTGLHDPDHYTTVRDMAVLLEYALQNDTFRQVFTTARYSTSPSELHPDGITFYSTLFTMADIPAEDGEGILGGKTGYTEQAGLCLASLIRKNGEEYVLVTAGAKGDHKTEQYNITDALTVYNEL